MEERLYLVTFVVKFELFITHVSVPNAELRIALVSITLLPINIVLLFKHSRIILRATIVLIVSRVVVLSPLIEIDILRLRRFILILMMVVALVMMISNLLDIMMR